MKNMSNTKLNTLPVPTFRWLGVNSTERDISGYEATDTDITAAAGESRSQVIFVGDEGVTNVNITAENGAAVKLVQVFDVQGTAVSNVRAKIGENAKFELVQLYLGGDVVSGIAADLNGRKAHFDADFGYLLNDSDSLDIELTANHYGRKTLSEINAKGVLNGSAEKVFKGTIDFKNGAVGAVGSEKEEVLLMSETAVNKTVPLILCAEEDVEGSHGASIGRLDEKQVFYMQSRGISEEKIYELAAQAKLKQILDKIDDETAVKRIKERLGRGEEDE